MKELVEVVGLEPVLRKFGVEYEGQDFELLYSELWQSGSHADCIGRLEQAVFDYFARLELPEHPTLYDHLVLSLRPKDLIATFNWDPFLWQALSRNSRRVPTPESVYLHGNVAVAYCTKHKPYTMGASGGRCGKCGSPLRASRLLYPVAAKDYNTDDCIAANWRVVRDYLKDAYVFTIFGYGAPATDVEAVELMKNAWGDANERGLDEVEIIDIREEGELRQSWRPFICREHCRVCRRFYESTIALQPRRSCEAMWDTLMQHTLHPDKSIPRDADWEELWGWYLPLIQQE